MKRKYELLIIGAGPAGMAAACKAVARGVQVCVIDDQPDPGGQIYRNVDKASPQVKEILGADYREGHVLVEKFIKSGGDYFANASVWYLDETNHVGIQQKGKTHFIYPEFLIIATGAQERPMPIKGWQLPGVMYAGAGQILLKSSSLVPGGKLVLAGSGPLLLLLANQYLRAGVKIQALLDTTPAGRLTQSFGKLIPAQKTYHDLVKGTGLIWNIKRAGVPYYKNVQGLSIAGNTKLDRVTFHAARKGSKQVSDGGIEADTLLLHQGVIPNVRIPLAAGCEIKWSDTQQGWNVNTDLYGLSHNSTYVIGDCARIVGAMASRYQGELSALHVAHRLGKVASKEFQDAQKSSLKLFRLHAAIRPFLDSMYAPSHEYLVPASEEVLVCRCEEVSVKQIREAISLGCVGPNQVKSFTRCGMGPCQGGQCASTVSRIIADELNQDMDEVGVLRVRPPLSPITLGQIADL